MKLKQWADKQGIKYLTAYRWFKAGTLPVSAYQTDSGTIIVEDDGAAPETNMQDDRKKDTVVSQILKKTVEFSKANGSVEDFAAYILSNYKIEQFPQPEVPKPRGPKPTAEMAQKHFKQFIKTPAKKPEANMFLMEQAALDKLSEVTSDLTSDAYSEESLAKEISSVFDPTGVMKVGTVVPSNGFVQGSSAQSNLGGASLLNSMHNAISGTTLTGTVKTYASVDSGAVFGRSVEPTSVAFNTAGGLRPTIGFVSEASANSQIQQNPILVTASAVQPAQTWNVSQPIRINHEEDLEEDEELIPFVRVTYNEARALTDLMLNKNLLVNDPLSIDQQAKEISKWSREAYDSMLRLLSKKV